MLGHYDGPAAALRKGWVKEDGEASSQLAELSQLGIRTTETLLGELGKKRELERARQLVDQLMALDE